MAWLGSAVGGLWTGLKEGGRTLVDIPGKITGAIGSSVFGQNSFRPGFRQIDEAASERDRFASLKPYQYQQGLLGRLDETMDGRGPSVAEIQMLQGTAEQMRNAGSMAANARGTSRALAQRSAMYGGLQAQQQANRDAALLRAQEQLSARQQAAGVAEQMQQADLQRRQQAIDIERANQQAYGQQQGQTTALTEGNATRMQKGTGALLSSVGGAIKGLFSDIRAKEDIQPVGFAERLSQELAVRPENESNADLVRSFNNSMAASDAAMQAQLQANQANQLQAPPENNALPGAGGGTPGVGGAIGGGIESFGNGLMSDRQSKERIIELETMLGMRPKRELDTIPQGTMGAGVLTDRDRQWLARPTGERLRDADEAFDGVRPYQYRYKPEFARYLAETTAPGNPAGQAAVMADARAPRTGVMAQDLERTPARIAVESTPVGKVIDERRALGVTLANQAALNQKLDAIERRLSRRM